MGQGSRRTLGRDLEKRGTKVLSPREVDRANLAMLRPEVLLAQQETRYRRPNGAVESVENLLIDLANSLCMRYRSLLTAVG